MDLQDLVYLQQEVKKWGLHNFPNSEPWMPLVGAMEELGELSHAHLKEAQGIRDKVLGAKEDAVGDIVIFLIDYCNRNNMDFSVCVNLAWNTANIRDWKKYPKNGVTA